MLAHTPTLDDEAGSPHDDEDSAMTKAEERARIRALRSARAADERQRAAEELSGRVLALLPPTPSVVTAYTAMPTEPGTGPLLAQILSAGHRLLLPRITGRTLAWVEVTSLDEFAVGPLGIHEPTGPALPDPPSPLAGADVLVMPGLAVDHRGKRLGQGGGYYDSALGPVPHHRDGGPLRVVLLFDDEFVELVPSEPHDCTVDVVVTPQRTVSVAAN
jgi:5-formyltetrahydrofolate cyclo-ligase